MEGRKEDAVACIGRARTALLHSKVQHCRYTETNPMNTLRVIFNGMNVRLSEKVDELLDAIRES
jgi:hypothetical protein